MFCHNAFVSQATHCVGVLMILLILAPDLSHLLSFEVSSLDEGEELKVIVLAQLNGFGSILVTIRSFEHLGLQSSS